MTDYIEEFTEMLKNLPLMRQEDIELKLMDYHDLENNAFEMLAYLLELKRREIKRKKIGNVSHWQELPEVPSE